MFPIFVFLWLASILGIFLGLIKPTLVLRWGAKRTRLRAFGWYCLFTVLFFIAAGVTAPKSNKVNQSPPPQENTSHTKGATTSETTLTQQKQDKNAGEKINDDKSIHINLGDSQANTIHENNGEEQLNKGKDKDKDVAKNNFFDFSVKTFIKRFNKSAKQLKQPTIHKSTVLNKDDNSGKIYTLMSSNKNIGFIVSTDNRGIVKESTMMGSGDGTPASGLRIIMGMASYFDVFDPEITANGRGKILRELGITSGSIPDKSTCTQKNVKYTLVNTKGVGLWIIAEPAK